MSICIQSLRSLKIAYVFSLELGVSAYAQLGYKSMVYGKGFSFYFLARITS